MIVVVQPSATPEQHSHIIDRIKELGLQPHVSSGQHHTVIGCIGDQARQYMEALQAVEGVEKVLPVENHYKLASQEFVATNTVIDLWGMPIGGEELTVIGGPCSVEGEEMLLETAREVRKQGGHILRGGAFKPRSSPYSFQGLGEEGLKLLAQARRETGLPVITEVMDTRQVELVARYTDIFQIGARNMQNFALLKAVGEHEKPVFLKRAMSATVDDVLLAAEYVMERGNKDVILCERGIRTFKTSTRNTFDLSAVATLKRKTHLPVFADPAHATGDRELVPEMAYAAVAAGADGLMVEVHPNPERAYSDGPQSLTFPAWQEMMGQVQEFARVTEQPLAPQVEVDRVRA